MIGNYSELQAESPKSLTEALELLANTTKPPLCILAGGTDAMMGLYRDGIVVSKNWLNLQKLRAELRFIRETENGWAIGAMTTVADLAKHSGLSEFCPMIPLAANWIAGKTIRNRATVGGNIVNGSPAADLSPVWLCLDAQVELASRGNRRKVAISEFWTGYKMNILEPDELLVSIHVEKFAELAPRFYYRKVAPRSANSISQVIFAGRYEIDPNNAYNNTRLAFGCMGPTPMRACQTEVLLNGKTKDALAVSEVMAKLREELHPRTDDRASAEYRLEVALNVCREFLMGHLRI